MTITTATPGSRVLLRAAAPLRRRTASRGIDRPRGGQAHPARRAGDRAPRRRRGVRRPARPSTARRSRSPARGVLRPAGPEPDDRARRVLHGPRVERRRGHRPRRRAGAVRRAAHRPDQAGVLQPAAHRAPPRPQPREHQGGAQPEHRGALRPVATRCSSSSSTRRCRTPRRCSTPWRPPPTLADLEAAQLHKVDAILDSAGVAAGSRVLEIGTGWGTLAIRAAQRGASVTSVTLSVEQADARPAAGGRRRGRRPGRGRGARLPRPGGRVRRRRERRDDRGGRRGVSGRVLRARSTRCSPPGARPRSRRS